MRALHAIVLAGGSGRRLAALTERMTGRPTPKQFCAFGSPRTLLQETVERLAPLVPGHRTNVVALETQRDLAAEQLRPFPEVTLLCQPADRGTAPGLLCALVHVLGRDPDALVLLTPSDHGVRNPEAFVRGLARARDAVNGASAVLLGVEADRPRPDYGWIVPGAELEPGVRRIAAFVEKPAPAEALALHAAGALFSTMILVARARALLGLVERARPGLAALFDPLPTLPAGACAIHLQRVYAVLRSCDFSNDILAAAPELGVVRLPEEVGWTDLGTPERVAEWLQGEPALLSA